MSYWKVVQPCLLFLGRSYLDAALRYRERTAQALSTYDKREHFWPSNPNLFFLQLPCAWQWLQTLLFLFPCQFPPPVAGNPGNFSWWHQFVYRVGLTCPMYTQTLKETNPLFPGHSLPGCPFQQMILASVIESKYSVCGVSMTYWSQSVCGAADKDAGLTEGGHQPLGQLPHKANHQHDFCVSKLSLAPLSSALQKSKQTLPSKVTPWVSPVSHSAASLHSHKATGMSHYITKTNTKAKKKTHNNKKTTPHQQISLGIPWLKTLWVFVGLVAPFGFDLNSPSCMLEGWSENHQTWEQLSNVWTPLIKMGW